MIPGGLFQVSFECKFPYRNRKLFYQIIKRTATQIITVQLELIFGHGFSDRTLLLSLLDVSGAVISANIDSFQYYNIVNQSCTTVIRITSIFLSL